MTGTQPSTSVRLAGGVVDLRIGLVRRADGSTRLTTRERELLAYLVARPGATVSFDELHLRVWGFHPSVISRAAYHTARRLRAKIERDPTSPEHIIGVHGEGVRFEPLATPVALGGHGLIGRDALIAELAERLAAGGATLLWGPAGVGKTALALACSASRGDASVIRLTGVVSEAELLTRVAATLELPGDADRDRLAARIEHALRDRDRRLLVLDNLEQLAPAALDRVRAWLETRAPSLLTSRHRLDGVETVAVPALAERDAIALLRARQPRALPPDETPALARLAGALDRLPLALELAAARLDLLSPTQLLARLAHRFELLQAAGDQARDVSLRGALAHSWDLLGAVERAALVSLASIPGTFGLDVAEALIGDADRLAVDLLATLVGKSLLQAEQPTTHGAVFRILESVRAFAYEPAAATAARLRLAEACVRWLGADGLGALFDRVDGAQLMDAVDTLIGADRLTDAAQLLCARAEHVRRAGPDPDLVSRLESLDVHRLPPRLQGQCWIALSRVAVAAGAHARALTAARRAAMLADERSDPRLRIEARTAESRAHAWAGDIAEAQLAIERALADAAPDAPPAVRADALTQRAVLHGFVGALDDAEADLQAAAFDLRRTTDDGGLGWVLSKLGFVAGMRGRLEEANDRLERALTLLGSPGLALRRCEVLLRLGMVEQERGRFARAHTHLVACHALARRLGDPAQAALADAALAEVALRREGPEDALMHAQRAVEQHRRGHDRNVLGWALSVLAEAEAANGNRLSAGDALADARRALEAAGAERNLVLWQLRRGMVALRLGDHGQARAALIAVEADLRAAKRTAADLGIQHDIARLRSALGGTEPPTTA